MQVGDYVEDPYITPAGDMLSRYNGVGFSTHDNKISNFAMNYINDSSNYLMSNFLYIASCFVD